MCGPPVKRCESGSIPEDGDLYFNNKIYYKMLKDFELLVIGKLIENNIIPSFELFQISETHILEYMRIYGILYSESNNALKSKTNLRYARKLAGLTLLKLNFERKAKFNEIRAGLIYLIENEVYPDYYKVGMTIDLNSRLRSYQTYDPLQRFKVVKYDFVLDRILAEKKILNHPKIFNEDGEWIKKHNAIKIFESICFKNF